VSGKRGRLWRLTGPGLDRTEGRRLGGAAITAEAKRTRQAEEVEVDQTVRLNVAVNEWVGTFRELVEFGRDHSASKSSSTGSMSGTSHCSRDKCIGWWVYWSAAALSVKVMRPAKE